MLSVCMVSKNYRWVIYSMLEGSAWWWLGAGTQERWQQRAQQLMQRYDSVDKQEHERVTNELKVRMRSSASRFQLLHVLSLLPRQVARFLLIPYTWQPWIFGFWLQVHAVHGSWQHMQDDLARKW
jgi:hypothetical protein